MPPLSAAQGLFAAGLAPRCSAPNDEPVARSRAVVPKRGYAARAYADGKAAG